MDVLYAIVRVNLGQLGHMLTMYESSSFFSLPVTDHIIVDKTLAGVKAYVESNNSMQYRLVEQCKEYVDCHCLLGCIPYVTLRVLLSLPEPIKSDKIWCCIVAFSPIVTHFMKSYNLRIRNLSMMFSNNTYLSKLYNAGMYSTTVAPMGSSMQVTGPNGNIIYSFTAYFMIIEARRDHITSDKIAALRLEYQGRHDCMPLTYTLYNDITSSCIITCTGTSLHTLLNDDMMFVGIHKLIQ